MISIPVISLSNNIAVLNAPAEYFVDNSFAIVSWVLEVGCKNNKAIQQNEGVRKKIKNSFINPLTAY
jgi:hypothetical protein